MVLIVESSDDALQEDFCKFLISCIQVDLQEQIHNKRNKLLDSHLNKLNDFINSPQSGYQKRCYGVKQLDIREIITQGIHNLTYEKSGGKYMIVIDPNANIPGTFISIKSACKLINYGNLIIRGTLIFNNEFKKIEDHIEDYIRLYREE